MFFIKNNTLEIFDNICVAYTLGLSNIFTYSGLLAFNRVFYNLAYFFWIIIVRGRPVVIAVVSHAPQPWVKAHLI